MPDARRAIKKPRTLQRDQTRFRSAQGQALITAGVYGKMRMVAWKNLPAAGRREAITEKEIPNPWRWLQVGYNCIHFITTFRFRYIHFVTNPVTDKKAINRNLQQPQRKNGAKSAVFSEQDSPRQPEIAPAILSPRILVGNPLPTPSPRLRRLPVRCAHSMARP